MKTIKLFCWILCGLLWLPSTTYSAGSCTQSDTAYQNAATVVTLTCTGDASDGSVPTITLDMSNIACSHYLYAVKAYPTPGGTAPDAADVAVMMNGQDLLGGQGVNLIHPTATQDVMPYSSFMGSWRFVLITDALSVVVSNQSTASAQYTITLIFVR